MTNQQVAQAWANGKSAKTNTMHTDGQYLFSYRLKIGYTNEQGEKIALQYTTPAKRFVSSTTSKQVGYANSYANKTEVPENHYSRY
jgi:uncharacterized protein YgiM (DUF1202 family)